MVNVLNILFDERVGGPPLRVLQVASRLHDAGFRTHVVIPRGDPLYGGMLRNAGIPLEEIPLVRLRETPNPVTHARFLLGFWPNVWNLQKIIRKRRIDLVHTNGLINLQPAIAASRCRVPLVWHLNDVCTPGLLRQVLTPLVRKWAKVIPISAKAVSDFYFPDGSLPSGQVHVLYPPVDTNQFNPSVTGASVRMEFGISSSAPVVGTVANIQPGKGIEHFVEAAPLIKARYPKAKFLVVGQLLANRRAFWKSLLQRSKQFGLAKDLIFTGRRQDVPQVLRAMNVFARASESESCPMAVIEACASGLPVVASDVGGTSEVVEQGLTGRLIRPRSPYEIAAGVLGFLESPQEAHRIGMAGAQRMKKLFSLESCVERHLAVYRAALQ